MAGDWIKMRIDLQSHPKVVRILSATGADKFRVIGGLHAVWSVFDTHSTDGILPGYSLDLMDHIIGWKGFSGAVASVGWLVETSDGNLEMPEFVEHNGQSAKRRAEDQKRKKNSRISPQSVRNPSASEPDKKRTREEKRREDIIDTTTVVSTARFTKPTLGDLITAFTGRVTDPTLQAQKFLNHYESNGWRVGKNPMKSWPHAVTNWITRGSENGNGHTGNVRNPSAAERTKAAIDEVFGPGPSDAFEGEFEPVDELAADPDTNPGHAPRLAAGAPGHTR